MGKRPAKCYRDPDPHPYTRSSRKRQSKNFIKGAPGSKIRTFDTGKPGQEYDVKITMVSTEPAQIRHGALEACRITCAKVLDGLEKNRYHMQIRAYPHHILRENARVTGAGADRVSKGMAKAFGRPIDRAARVKKGQIIMSIETYLDQEKKLSKLLKRASNKLPCRCIVETVPLKK